MIIMICTFIEGLIQYDEDEIAGEAEMRELTPVALVNPNPNRTVLGGSFE